MWPPSNQLQTGTQVLQRHWIPLDMLCIVLLLQRTHRQSQINKLTRVSVRFWHRYWPALEKSLLCLQNVGASRWQSWYKVVQNCSFPDPVKNRVWLINFCVKEHLSLILAEYRLRQRTDLKPIEVNYTHTAVHLCGTEPVIDLLQQPIKQHWVQSFGNGISRHEIRKMSSIK